MEGPLSKVGVSPRACVSVYALVLTQEPSFGDRGGTVHQQTGMMMINYLLKFQLPTLRLHKWLRVSGAARAVGVLPHCQDTGEESLMEMIARNDALWKCLAD